MISWPTNYLIIEGCDCSGKTTLVRELHKTSNFRWNIQDRSFLSMLVYAKLYGRETGLMARGLWDELTNLNNRFAFLLPTWEVILERFKTRGDDIQDERSLQKVVDLFFDHDWLTSFPNVMLLDNTDEELESLEDTANQVVGWVKTKEEYSLKDLAAEVLRFVSVMPTGDLDNMRGFESRLNFSFYDDLSFEEADPGIMRDEKAGEYYQIIFDRLLGKIRDEIAGRNEYGEKQTGASRRFIYTDDSCISFIQVLLRDGVMNFHAVLRSSNVAKTFPLDLQFLYYLASEVYKGCEDLHSIRAVQFRITLNSAHLVR